MEKSSPQKNKTEIADVGKRILENRKKQGMTREQLSERSGLAVQSLVKIETGSRDFRISTLISLARGLGMSADYLLGLSECDDDDNVLVLNFYVGP